MLLKALHVPWSVLKPGHTGFRAVAGALRQADWGSAHHDLGHATAMTQRTGCMAMVHTEIREWLSGAIAMPQI